MEIQMEMYLQKIYLDFNMVKKYLKTGAGAITGAILTGAIPNPTGNATVNTMQSNVATGYGNIGKAFPAMGSMVGAGMIMKATGKLSKKARKIYK